MGRVRHRPVRVPRRSGEEVYRTASSAQAPSRSSECVPRSTPNWEAFDDHFRGRPKIDILRLDVVPEPSVRMIALQTGDAHSSVWPLLVEDSLVLAEDPNSLVYATLGNSIKHFPLNTLPPQLSEKEVRQAMMHALDRQRIIDGFRSGTATVAHSNIPPSSYYHRSDLKQYEVDPR
ncbi:MAG: ABC transporter substrate-binding protein [Caldilineaceae bacterium]